MLHLSMDLEVVDISFLLREKQGGQPVELPASTEWINGHTSTFSDEKSRPNCTRSDDLFLPDMENSPAAMSLGHMLAMTCSIGGQVDLN